jgi:CheY-like chemotaxis protein
VTPRVLYIEDTPVNVALVEAMLRRRPGVRLSVAATGEDGVATARAEPPALVLLDLHLPDIDGHEVLRRLRDDAATRETPVVVVSADATIDARERMLAAGAARYLTKPVAMADLLAAVDDLAAQPRPRAAFSAATGGTRPATT